MFPLSLMALALMQAAAQEPPHKPAASSSVVASAARERHPDESDSFELVFALLGGGGQSRHGSTSWFGGLKVGAGCCTRGAHPNEKGRTITLDLGYDRLGSYDGFSAEVSTMIPVVRFPRPRSETSNYLRVYAEPGVGMRAGGDGGAYLSGKIMIAWLSDQRIFKPGDSPFVEIQGRFALDDAHHHDIRILVGAITTLCRHC